jgi:8-oxo-dGTP diphosphatase
VGSGPRVGQAGEGEPWPGPAADAPVRVVAAVVRRDERVLVCRRPEHKRHGGLWEFPGGKCEPGESDLEALRRELREELGVEVSWAGAAEWEARDPGSPFLVAFVPVRVVGDPVCHEHTALRWGTPGEVARLPLAPTDRAYVAWLRGGG